MRLAQSVAAIYRLQITLASQPLFLSIHKESLKRNEVALQCLQQTRFGCDASIEQD